MILTYHYWYISFDWWHDQKRSSHNIPIKIILWKPIIFLCHNASGSAKKKHLLCRNMYLVSNLQLIHEWFFCVWKSMLFLRHNTLAFDRNNTYLEEIIPREKCALSQFCSCCMTEIWNPILFLSHNASGFDKNKVYFAEIIVWEKQAWF